MNYYFPPTVTDDRTGPPPRARTIHREGVPRTGVDWKIDATGIETLLLRLTREYGARKLYVKENGSAFPDVVRPGRHSGRPGASGVRPEPPCGLSLGRPQGAPLAGYFAWSLLDDFEWV
ncbi:family 1 glycosylhydrolase [Streptomyces sp. bgisy032]|uniref:family 1 glycosylhydrolase n=1 Tax=Streptomyces sp. bgisy032 TaxID=3413773 RepID=UPI003D755912